MGHMRIVTLPPVPVEFAEAAELCVATEVVIGGQTVIGIADARDLHAGLEVGRDYTNWIKRRIEKYGFREGADYEVISVKESCSPDLASKHGGHNATIYTLSLNMAKELAMVENNDKGRMIRRYYLWLEQKLAEQTGGDREERLTVTPSQLQLIVQAAVNALRAVSPQFGENPVNLHATAAATMPLTAEEAFLDGVKAYEREGRTLSSSPHAANYAPKVLLRRPECRGFLRDDLEKAMEGLFQAGRIRQNTAHHGKRWGERRIIPV